MFKTPSLNRDYYLPLGAMVGGPVLLYFSTSLLYRLIAPHVLIDEFQLTRMLWAAVCGGWLGALTLDLCCGGDNLSKRVDQLKSNVVPLVFFTCCYLWGRRDEFVESLPGPISIFVWCWVLVGLCYWMQKKTSANSLLGWQEPTAIVDARLSAFYRDGNYHRTLKRGIILQITLLLFLVGCFVFAPQLLQSQWFIFVYSVALSLTFSYVVVPLLFFCHSRIRRTYEINSEGLVSQDILSRQQYQWSDIEFYSLGANMSVPGMRWLHLEIRKSEKTEDGLFSFDPQEVEEDRVRQILHEHLGPVREVANA